jgi:hypothetical protein
VFLSGSVFIHIQSTFLKDNANQYQELKDIALVVSSRLQLSSGQ